MWLYVFGVASLVIVRCGLGFAFSSALAHGSLVPVVDEEAQAVSLILPASRSAWVIVCVPVHSIDLVGAKVAGLDGEHVKLASDGVPVSSTNTLLSVTLPSLVATIVYVITSPSLL